MSRSELHEIYKRVVNSETWKDEYDLNPDEKLKEFDLTEDEKNNIKKMLELF